MESQLQAACDLAVHSAVSLTYKRPLTLSGEAAVMVTAGTNPRGDGERGKKGGPRLLIWEIMTKLHLCTSLSPRLHKPSPLRCAGRPE